MKRNIFVKTLLTGLMICLLSASAFAGAETTPSKKNKPANGLVQALVVTEKQFSNIVNISGQFVSNVIDSDERLVIL